MTAESIEAITFDFENAVTRFAITCFRMTANEKSFQGWLVSSLIEKFGPARVYREIHLLKQDLNELQTANLFNEFFKKGNELFPDVSISWDSNIDTRHSAARSDDVKKAGDLLLKFAILSELKVTGSTKHRTPMQNILRDIKKLALFSHAHDVQAEKGGDTSKLQTYMIVLDNHSKERTFSLEDMKPLKDWKADIQKPTMLVFYSEEDGITLDVYRDFNFSGRRRLTSRSS